MPQSTITFLLFLALSCTIPGIAGCSCFEQRTTPHLFSTFEQTDRRSQALAQVAVARASSPEKDGNEATAIHLGAPMPIVVTESENLHVLFGTGTSNTLCESDLSWHADKSNFLSDFRADLESLCTRENALLLLGAGSVSYAMHESLDDDVAENTARHRNRWGKTQNFIAGIGNPPHQLAAISGLYAYSLLQDDVESHELSKSLLNAVAITEMGTTMLKFAANTGRPNGDSYGWPSGHTSSSFAFASVLDEYYGHWFGIPAYTVAGLVAWERIDDREHDLSDVVFGAALGYVIGRTVAHDHHTRICGMQLEPFTNPATGSTGIALERRF